MDSNCSCYDPRDIYLDGATLGQVKTANSASIAMANKNGHSRMSCYIVKNDGGPLLGHDSKDNAQYSIIILSLSVYIHAKYIFYLSISEDNFE